MIECKRNRRNNISIGSIFGCRRTQSGKCKSSHNLYRVTSVACCDQVRRREIRREACTLLLLGNKPDDTHSINPDCSLTANFELLSTSVQISPLLNIHLHRCTRLNSGDEGIHCCRVLSDLTSICIRRRLPGTIFTVTKF